MKLITLAIVLATAVIAGSIFSEPADPLHKLIAHEAPVDKNGCHYHKDYGGYHCH